MTVITRFAPSPTGMLHIGGARTALFNYLFAKHTGGEFKLRIEDTDAARNSAAAYQAILDGLNWLGLPFDGDVIYQSKNVARHQEVAGQLVKNGGAYYCYTTPEQLAGQRAAAEAKGDVFKYDRRWRDSQETPPEDVTPSVRIKSPLTGSITVIDHVLGEVTVEAAELDDMVILRSDGTPTYMHAVVVDDHDMGVTHVIRGADHFTNMFRQCVLYDAMGWQRPEFAHIPLINDETGHKLSKRKGAASTTDYADKGYLPEAMRNYLAKLGWGHGDDEIFTDAQAIEWFTLEHIGKAPARLDFAKLNHVNAHYLRQIPPEQLAQLLIPFLRAAQQAPHSPLEREPAITEAMPLLVRALPSVINKVQTLVELADAVKFYLTAPAAYDEKAKAMLTKNGPNIPLVLPALEALSEPWCADSVKAAIHDVSTASGKKIGELMPPLRAAIVGAMSGPDIPDAMAILGKAESVNRLKRAIA